MSFGTGGDGEPDVSGELISDASIWRDAGGTSATVKYIVGDVSGSGVERYTNAIDREGIPDVGDEHPRVQGLFVTGINAAPAEGEAEIWIVAVQYSVGSSIDQAKGYSESEISISTTTEETTTNKDAYGQLMTTGAELTETIHLSQVTRFRYTVSIRRTEKELDIPRHRSLLGKANTDSWFYGAPYTWLCTNIDVSKNYNDGYDVTYEFAQNELTWRFNSITYDVITGDPVSNMFDVYGAANYESHDLLFGIVDEEA